MIFWWILIPISKYGGYAYLLFGIFSLCIYFNLIKSISFKQLNAIMVICIIYFLGKSIDRISSEYIDQQYSNQSTLILVYCNSKFLVW